MTLTLGITGMDRATEAAVQAAFKAANAETGDCWTLTSSTDADYVVIDLDSLYGPMSLLKLHTAGKKIIGLTSVERSQTEYRLQHPVNVNDLAVLLSEIATDEAAPPSTAAPQIVHAEEVEAPEPESEPETPPDVSPAAAQHTLFEWLQQGLPQAYAQLQRDGLPSLLLDFNTHTWHGSSALKPLAPWFEDSLTEEDFQPLDHATWERLAASLGPAQPMARLLWLGGLLSKAPTSGHYVMTKWPQTEREFPKHFRIATAMMKGPATVAAIAEASAVPEEEVADCINANLATQHAEHVPDAPAPAPLQAQKHTGLFGRLRSH